jgi:CDP-glycerol glycerophosphotransferase
VASFSFGAGNAAKLLRIPLYLAGRVATWLIPRTRDEWVFGCAVGIADGALALWDHARQAGERAVWLTADATQDEAAAARAIPTVRRDSLAGFWRTARARVVVVTHGFGDVNRYATSGAFVVQLWHGIPLKRIGLDSPATLRAPLPVLRPAIRALYRATQRRIDLIPAASHLVRGRLESAFALTDDHVPVTGEPRVDVLSMGEPADRAAAARARLQEVLTATGSMVLGERPVVLYAPTWRDGADDPAVPSRGDWRAIHAMLEEHDAMLFVRSHPLGAGDYAAGVGERVRMLGSDLVSDVTPLLPAVTVLVTDYSSLVFDASLVPVPVVFLAPDAAEYAVERGFYGRYDDVTGGEHVLTWSQAIERVSAVLGDAEESERLTERARRLDREVHAHRDGRNTIRVYERIREGLDG